MNISDSILYNISLHIVLEYNCDKIQIGNKRGGSYVKRKDEK